MNGKYALIIGNTEYADSGLAQLTAPGRDIEDLARVLKDQEICAFEQVNVLLNQPEHLIRRSIDEFFDEKKPDDLLLLYFSGHGVRDELGALYLAVKNTNRFRLRSTAIKSDFIREAMDQSRSNRQVLILDCCNSGAFAQGTKASTGTSIGTASAFEVGYGRIILTASDTTQYAWEGDKVIGETDNSLFTHFLVEGLEGKADLDGDGRITVDELYDYAYDQVKLVTPKQTPSKFARKQQGEIVLRHNIPVEATVPVPLPDDLIAATNSSLTYIREGAVRQLEELLKGKNLGMVRSARLALEKITEEDDSRRVSQLAMQVLNPIRESEHKAEEARKAGQEVKRGVIREAEEQGLVQEEYEATEKINKLTLTPRWLPVFWITLGWAIGGAVNWLIGPPIGEVMGWVIGGLGIATILHKENVLSDWKSLLWITPGWAIARIVSICSGILCLPLGAIGGAVGGAVGGLAMAITLHTEGILSDWKGMLWVTLGWAGTGLAAAIVWALGQVIAMQINGVLGWAIGGAVVWGIGGTIGGLLMIWQIRAGDKRR